MALNQQSLLSRMEPSTEWDKRLIVEPFFKESITQPSTSPSINFHLGNRFTIPRSRRSAQHDPLSSEPKEDVVPRELFIPMGEKFILNPGQLILGITLEWFRFPFDLNANVEGRSIWGRRGLVIVTASVVHAGSSGTITLEMTNLGEVGLHLKPGAAIGQLLFYEVSPTPSIQERRSTFTGAIRPILGKYTKSKVEDLLLGLD